MKTTSKARLIETMGLLLQSQGFHATGMSQVLRESEAPRGSLYFHFPGGKEELACAALDRAGHAFRHRLDRLLATASSPAEAVDVVCRTLGQALETSSYTAGSPLATTVLEVASGSPRVREICARHFAAWEERLGHCLRVLGVDADRAPVLATLVLSAIEGALVLCRAHGSTAPFDRVAEGLKLAIAAP